MQRFVLVGLWLDTLLFIHSQLLAERLAHAWLRAGCWGLRGQEAS